MKIDPTKGKSALIFAQLVLDYYNTHGMIPTAGTQLDGVPMDLRSCADNDLAFLRSMVEANPATNVRTLLEDTVRAMAHIIRELESRNLLESEAQEEELESLISAATAIANSEKEE